MPPTWTDSSGVKVTKIYTFQRGSFLVELNQWVENGTASDWQGQPVPAVPAHPAENQQQLLWRRRDHLYRGR